MVVWVGGALGGEVFEERGRRDSEGELLVELLLDVALHRFGCSHGG